MSADIGFWNEARTAMLKKLHEDRLSNALIAVELDCTKGMVSGKINRLGLNNGWVPKIRAPRRNQFSNPLGQKAGGQRRLGINADCCNAARNAALKPTLRAKDPGIEAHEPPAPLECRRIGIMELTDKTCRFPLGDPGKPGFAYCGLELVDESPYCHHHDIIAHGRAV